MIYTHKTIQLQQIVFILKYLQAKYHLYPVFAAEIEFYLICTGDDRKILLDLEESLGLRVQKERGDRQYEIATDIYNDPLLFIDALENIRNRIRTTIQNHSDTKVSFIPKPYSNDYGSAMHFHMHLSDIKGGNVFNEGEIIKNELLMHSIGGILALLNKSLYMITGDDQNEFDRFVAGYMAPMNISWGKNNRTTAIRIPETNPFMRHRRVEFRVPSAQSCIVSVVLFLVAAVLHGLSNRIAPGDCIYGNAYDEIYALTRLCSSAQEANDCFSFHEIISELLKLNV